MDHIQRQKAHLVRDSRSIPKPVTVSMTSGILQSHPVDVNTRKSIGSSMRSKINQAPMSHTRALDHLYHASRRSLPSPRPPLLGPDQDLDPDPDATRELEPEAHLQQQHRRPNPAIRQNTTHVYPSHQRDLH